MTFDKHLVADFLVIAVLISSALFLKDRYVRAEEWVCTYNFMTDLSHGPENTVVKPYCVIKNRGPVLVETLEQYAGNLTMNWSNITLA